MSELSKLTAREKVAIYIGVFLMRWLVPRMQLDEPTQKLFDDILHQVRCNL